MARTGSFWALRDPGEAARDAEKICGDGEVKDRGGQKNFFK